MSRNNSTIYIGARQVSSGNQDPIVVRFDNGRRTWCRDDLERSGDDGRGYGLFWSDDVLLGVVSATGNQGDGTNDLRRFTNAGWLTSYGAASPRGGGGPKVAAVIGLDPSSGNGRAAIGTWLTALNADGKVNSLVVRSIASAGGGVRIGVRSWFAPRGANRQAMTCTGASPFDVVYTFDSDLRTVTAVDGSGRCR